MINFELKYSNEICGGLNIQMVGKYNNTDILEGVGFKKSLCVSEYAFCLLEFFFAKHLENFAKFYHYGTNFHDKNSLGNILSDLKYYPNTLYNADGIDIKLNWTTDELKIFLDNHKHDKNLKKDIIIFIQNVVDFLSALYQDDDCLGVYVIGI